MIIYFRKLRKKLLAEGRTSRYLKYALGEVVLVMIGILLALQVNNWNEKRKIEGNQEKYVALLKIEALNNLKEINKAIQIASTTNVWQIKIFELMDGNHDTITERYLSQVFGKVFVYTHNFKYENSALTDLKSSGNLKNILNDSLRKYLIAIEPLVLDVQGQEQNVKEDFEEITEYLKSNGTFRTMANHNGRADEIGIPKSLKTYRSNIPLLAKDEFENRLLTYTGTTKNLFHNHYPKLKIHLGKIVEIIEKEYPLKK